MMPCILVYGDDYVPTYDIAQRLIAWQERVTGSAKQIDTDHAYVHEGIAYDAFWVGAVNATTMKFQFSTPSAKYVHFRPANIGISANTATLRIFLTATGTTAPVSEGSAVTPVNRKHTSTNTSGVTFKTGITTSSTGDFTEKYVTRVHGGSGPGQSVVGQSKGEPLEWIFMPGRDYVFMLTTTDDTNVNLNLFWYEEDNA